MTLWKIIMCSFWCMTKLWFASVCRWGDVLFKIFWFFIALIQLNWMKLAKFFMTRETFWSWSVSGIWETKKNIKITRFNLKFWFIHFQNHKTAALHPGVLKISCKSNLRASLTWLIGSQGDSSREKWAEQKFKTFCFYFTDFWDLFYSTQSLQA